MENREGVASIPLAAGRWDFGRFLGSGELGEEGEELGRKNANCEQREEKGKRKASSVHCNVVVGLVQGSRETLFEELLLSRCFPGRVVWRPELGLKTPLTTI